MVRNSLKQLIKIKIPPRQSDQWQSKRFTWLKIQVFDSIKNVHEQNAKLTQMVLGKKLKGKLFVILHDNSSVS